MFNWGRGNAFGIQPNRYGQSPQGMNGFVGYNRHLSPRYSTPIRNSGAQSWMGSEMARMPATSVQQGNTQNTGRAWRWGGFSGNEYARNPYDQQIAMSTWGRAFKKRKKRK